MSSNAIGKQLVDRRRPPREWFPHAEVDDRPASSSFPSGHTAGAVAFTAAVIGLAGAWAARSLPRLLLLAVRRLP
ncbi:phosphatase PAP2 family protein [Streptomyces scabiei]|uniref:phosphatase PAP2 family protein n=1 Tax=Streptomyces TaxID=1883 RepID=UPI0035AB6FC5